MHVKATGNQIEQFPYSLRDLRKDNQKTSFPRQITDALAASYGVYPVTVADRPDAPAGKVAERNATPTLINGAWVLGWTLRDMTGGEIAGTRAKLHEDLAAHRWGIETGGVTLPGGTIETTREAQAQIGSTYSALKDGLVSSVEWKAATGWLVLDLAAFTPIAQAVAAHVQECFAAERAVATQIDALTDAELPGFDVAATFDAIKGGA